MFYMELDYKDYLILEALKKDSKQTTRKLSKKLNIPLTTVHHRIKKLKKQEIIKNYTIDIDYKKINKNFLGFVLINANLEKLKEKNKTQYDLIKEIKKNHFVKEVYIISGKTDLIAKIRARDVEEFDKYLLTKLQTIEGIKNTESLIVINKGE